MKNLQEKINIILEDLYQIDDSFKKYEKDLRQLIKSLLELKPKAEIDEDFRQELKAKILAKIEEIKAKKEAKKTSAFSSLSAFKLPAYAAVGISAIILIVIAGNMYYKDQVSLTELDFTKGLALNTLTQDRAFGSLKSDTPQGTADGLGAATPASEGKGETLQESAIEAPQIKRSEAGGGSEIGIPGEFVNYEYIYDGDLDLEGDSVQVLKRLTKIDSNNQFMQIINQFDLGLMNLNKFSNTSIETINFKEDKKYGYTIFVNFSQGMISIHKNWESWQTKARCEAGGGRCFPSPQEPLDPEDIPNDSKLIQITKKFLNNYNIDLSPYGQPEVYRGRQFFIQESSRQKGLMVPQEIRVVYPFVIKGKKVYGTNGEPFGLNVSVDVRENRVAGVYNLTTHQYDQSNYAMASEEEIIEYAKKGAGLGHYYPLRDNDAKTEQVELGEPQEGYLKHWKPGDSASRPDELLIPALIFPVKEKPADASFNFKEKVIVPLAKDLLENNNYPVPLLKEQ